MQIPDLLSRRVSACALFCVLLNSLALAAPTANNDSYSVLEDGILTVSNEPLISEDFNTGGSGGSAIPFAGAWDYFDKIQNTNGANHSYPVDGTLKAWNAVGFSKATSTIGSWLTGAMPLQSGGINGFPGAADVLAGVSAAGNGQNLITTYLFRNTFTLNASQAAQANWTLHYLVDDGYVLYINGTEVDRVNIAAGTVTTNTFASTGNEGSYTDKVISLAGGILVAGTNTIAVEVHQTSATSTDVGIDLSLIASGTLNGSFVYQDDVFGTNLANNASGDLDSTGGFGGTAGLHVQTQGGSWFQGTTGEKSGAWRRSFTLSSAASVNVSLRFSLNTANGFDASDYAEALLDIDGTRYGSAVNNSLFHIDDGGSSGWQTVSLNIPLSAGAHTLSLGMYNNASDRGNEDADVWFDDVVVQFLGGAGGVLENDIGNNPTASLVSTTAHGVLSLNADGTFTYAPAANYFGADTFTYRAVDGTGTSNLATVTINVTSVNDAPVANPNSYIIAEDIVLNVPVLIGLLANDTDQENQPLSAILTSQASNGTVLLNVNGSFTYTPAANFFGSDSFTYVASDGGASSQPATVTITITAVNDAPIANSDNYTADENIPLVISESGRGIVVFSSTFDSGIPAGIAGGGGTEAVQGLGGTGPSGNQFGGLLYRNATGVAGNGFQTPTTLTLTNLPAHTSLSVEFLLAILDSWDGITGSNVDIFGIQLDGIIIFQHYPDADLTQQSYVAPTGGLLSSGTNLGFSANNDSVYDMSLDAALRDIPHTASTATLSFFAGGSNWDGGTDESWAMDNLKVTVSSTPRQALVPLASNWRYLDNGSDQGTAWRAAAFNDGTWASGPAQLGYGDSDEATQIGFGPDSGNKYPTYYFRTAFNVADPNQFSALLVQVVHDDGAAVYLNGTEIVRTNLAVAADAGEFTLSTMPNELENSAFSHSIDPSLLVAGNNVIAVEVHQVTASSTDVSFSLALHGIPSRLSAGVLANDIEVDGQALSASLVGNASNGNVVLNPDGTFTYTPGVNFHGTDTFVYAASDGALSTNGTVTITVIPGPNDLPETVVDTYNGTEDQTLVVPVGTGVLSNDVDPDLDPLTALLHTQAGNGVVTLNPNGSFTYVPAPDFSGTDTFLYIVNDTIGNSIPTQVTLNIAAVNDRPVANNDVFVAQPGQLLTVAAPGILANDTDADIGTDLTAQLVTGTASGTLNFSSNGSFTYSPPVAFIGSVTFTYRASDSILTSTNAATVTIHVNGRPTAGTNSYTVLEDQTLAVPANGVLANDSDPESTPLTAVLISGPTKGTLNLSSSGSFLYTPNANYAGPDSFVYAASDGLQNSSNTSVSITVTPVNDAPVASDDEYALLTGETIAIAAFEGVLANDSDVDGPTISAALLSTTINGTLSLAANGSFSYTPNVGFTGIDTFTYAATDGTLNSNPATVTLAVAPATDAIVIHEIMYHPASENSLQEFIELKNIGDASVDLTGWQFTSGISFTFPSVSIPAGGYLIVAADTSVFTSTYGAVPLIVGNWTGGLSNRGERIKLVDSTGIVSGDITYTDQGDWAIRQSVTDGSQQGWIWFAAHDGGGSSLELINAALTNKSGQNWASSVGAPTPGAANSVVKAESAPLISDVKHSPPVPKSTDFVTITAKLKDVADSTLTATLLRRASTSSPGPFISSTMFDDGLHGDGKAGDGEFGVILPPAANLTIYEFYVQASDGANFRTWPAATNTGQNANALYQVDNEVFTGKYPIYRAIITQADEDRFPFSNRQSNAEMNTTFIADNCGDISVRYRCSKRIRGASSRNDTPPPTRLNIPTDNPWDGETRLNLNTQYTWLQFIGMKFFQASGIAAPDTKRVAMRRNGVDQSESGQEGYGSIVHMQPLQEEFLDTHINGDASGNIYKKVRPDVDWAYRSGNVARYLSDGWTKQTNASENNWSDLDEWLRVMNQATGAPDYIAQVEVVANLDQWMKWFAINTILANGETNASNGADDDYSMYNSPTDPRFTFLPHDLDTILGKGDSSTLTDPQTTIFDMTARGDTLAPLIPLFQNASILTRYYTALREQLQTTFSQDQFNAMIDNHLTGWVPAQSIADMKAYMDLRRAYITGLVNAQLGAPPALTAATTNATLTSVHGSLYISEVLANNVSAYNVSGLFPDVIELKNSGASAVNLGGMTISDDPALPARYTIPANTMIPAGGYFVLTSNIIGFGLDSDGDTVYLYNSGGTLLDSISFGLQIPDRSIGRTGVNEETWTLTQPSVGVANIVQALGSPDTLFINEWLVRPQVTFDRDFVELYNPAVLPVALGGLVITDEPVADPQRHILPKLSFIKASGFALLYPLGSNYSPDNASQMPFKLAAGYGWLSVSGTNGIEIDEVHYICQRDDVAFGRENDGISTIIDFDLPTPGFSNQTDLSVESNLLESLRITEIMYHPSLGGDLEYLRLKNIGSSPINLDGIRMVTGITMSLPAVILAPGAEGVIVRDQPLYESIYGTAGMLGQYSGNLSNSGENLRLEIISLGYGILDFDFKDGWYPATDGAGASLGIVNANAARNTWGDKESWMALGPDNSTYGGWASGHFLVDNLAVIGREADPDQDEISNGMEYALGLNPNVGDPSGLPTGVIEGGFLTMTYTRNKNADVQWIVEVSGDLINWDSGPSFATESMQTDNGTIQTWKATDSVPITGATRRHMRVKVIVR